MIFLIHGPDTHRSRQKLKEILEELGRRTGKDFLLYRFDAEERDWQGFKSSIETQSLFSSRKTILVENMAASSWEIQICETLLKQVSGAKEIDLILWEREVAGIALERLKRFQKFSDKAQEFGILAGRSLALWIEEQAKKRGFRLYPVHFAALASFGGDSWAIANEMDKWIADGQFEFGAGASRNYTIFDLVDTFFSSPREALKILLELLEDGEDEFRVFTHLAGHNRKLLAMEPYFSRGVQPPSTLGVHPFVVKKSASVLRKVTRRQLEENQKNFFEKDLQIKTGLIAPKEALVQMLMKIF